MGAVPRDPGMPAGKSGDIWLSLGSGVGGWGGGESQENHHRKWPPAGQGSEPSLEGKVWGFLFRFQVGKLQPFCMDPVFCPASAAMARHPSPLPKSKGKSLDGTEYRTVAVGKSLLLDGLRFSHSKMDPSRNFQ